MRAGWAVVAAACGGVQAPAPADVVGVPVTVAEYADTTAGDTVSVLLHRP